MHAQCTICGDIFTGTHPEVVHSTPCGHLFHYVCLIEWLQRSKTCPQCRARVVENKTMKIYFQVSSHSSSTQDSGMLENEVQNLKFELKMKNMDVEALKKETDLAKIQANELRQKVKKREEQIRNHETVVDCLQQHIKTLKQEIKTLMEYRLETDELRNKVENLQKELDSLESFKRIIKGSASEASEQLSLMRDKDPVALSSCIRSLKKQIETDAQKIRYLNAQLKRTEDRLSNVIAEVDKLRSENLVLNRAFHDIPFPGNPRKRLAPNQQEDDSITMIHELDKTDGANYHSNLEIIEPDSAMHRICSNGLINSNENRRPSSPTSPFSSRRLLTKSKSLLNKRESTIKSSSNQMSVCYDGLGGHLHEEVTFSDRATLLRDIGSDRSNKLQLPKKTKTMSNTKKTTKNGDLLRFYSRKSDLGEKTMI